jgi:hypothetical protein
MEDVNDGNGSSQSDEKVVFCVPFNLNEGYTLQMYHLIFECFVI